MNKLIANYYAKRGYVLHAAHQNQEAEGQYAKAYAGGSTNGTALCAYGLLLLRKGEADKALEVLEYVPKKCKLNRVKQLYWQKNLGLVYWKLGRVDEAVEVYEDLFKFEKNALSLAGTLGFLLIAQGDRTGDYTKAWEMNQKGYEYDEEDPVVLDNLGQLHFRAGELEKAAPYFEQALKYNPGQFDSLVFLAKCRVKDGKTDEAVDLMKKALAKKYSNLNTVPLEDAKAFYTEITKDRPDAALPETNEEEEKNAESEGH